MTALTPLTVIIRPDALDLDAFTRCRQRYGADLAKAHSPGAPSYSLRVPSDQCDAFRDAVRHVQGVVSTTLRQARRPPPLGLYARIPRSPDQV